MDYIYLIESYSEHETLYKIGFSKHPQKRLKEIKTGNPTKLSIIYLFNTKHGRKVETCIHHHYEHKLYDGEWFRLDDDDVKKFENMCIILEKSFDFNFD